VRAALRCSLAAAVLGLGQGGRPAAAAAATPWIDAGHSVVAVAAFLELPAATRSSVVALLKKHPSFDSWELRGDLSQEALQMRLFMRASGWPDEIRREEHPLHADHRGEDHYINLPYAAGGFPLGEEQSLIGLLSRPNIVRRLNESRTVLQDALVEAPVRAKELCWLLHLMGDIHQPLHCAALYSRRYPQGDRGGNLCVASERRVELKPPAAGEPLGLPTLHYFWDAAAGTDPGLDAVRRTAADCSILARDSVRDLKSFSPVRWAQEGFKLAVDGAYSAEVQEAMSDAEARAALLAGRPLVIPALSAAYQEAARALSRKQVALAGRRLASVLREIFGDAR
jgi:hypothetical protein